MIGEILIFFAQYGIYIIIAISLIAALIDTKHAILNTAKSLIAVGLSLAVAYGISSVFYAPRPFLKGNFTPLIPHDADAAFPSHHASAGFAFSTSAFYLNRILGILSVAVSCLMSIGRIYAGLHSGMDIIGGIFIGGLCGIFACSGFADKILRRLKNKIKYNRQKKAAHKLASARPHKGRQNPKRR